jgi:hypothetical protein
VWSDFVASVLGTVVVANTMHAISKMYRHIDHGQVVDALERRYAQSWWKKTRREGRVVKRVFGPIWPELPAMVGKHD